MATADEGEANVERLIAAFPDTEKISEAPRPDQTCPICGYINPYGSSKCGGDCGYLPENGMARVAN